MLSGGGAPGALVEFVSKESAAHPPSNRHSVARRAGYLGWYLGMGAVRPLRAPVRFVIVATPRSGSELLVELLDGQPGVRCHGELFKHPPRWPVRFLDGQAAMARARGSHVYGCKILGHDLSWHPHVYGGRAFIERLAGDGWQFIELQRDDLFLQAVSLLEGVRRQLHHRVGDERDPHPVVIDPVELMSVMFSLEQESVFVSDVLSTVPHLAIRYESDLLEGEAQAATVARIAARLGLGPADVRVRLQRSGASVPLAQRVANHDELVSVLAGTRFSRFLATPAAGA